MFLKGGLHTVWSYAKEVLFPFFCLGCGIESFVLCDTCYVSINKKPVLCCPVCHASNVNGTPCTSCAADSFLDQHFACVPYDQSGLFAQVLHQFKYGFVSECGSVFKRMIDEMARIFFGFLFPIDYCVPVPLHKRRYAERGYNQSNFIAENLVMHVSCTLHQDFLVRIVNTKQQAFLSKEERKQNVRAAFKVIKPNETKGKSILLVDDVYTTGSTMQATARALKEEGGALRVVGFSLARG